MLVILVAIKSFLSLGELGCQSIVERALGVGFEVLQLILLLALLAIDIDLLDALARGRLTCLGTGLALRGRRLTTFRHCVWWFNGG